MKYRKFLCYTFPFYPHFDSRSIYLYRLVISFSTLITSFEIKPMKSKFFLHILHCGCVTANGIRCGRMQYEVRISCTSTSRIHTAGCDSRNA